MRKSLGGGSHRKRSSGGRIQRDISQLRAWAKEKTRLKLTMEGEFCLGYLGEITEKSIPELGVSDFFEFKGLGVTVVLMPESWSRSELSPAGAETVLEVHGKRGGHGLTISEFSRHGPGTVNFRKVLDQLTDWSTMKAELVVSFVIGPCTPSFVSRIQVADPSGVFSFLGNRSWLAVDIRKYDMMGFKVQDQHTTVLLIDSARGESLQISDAPMNHAQVLEQFQSGTA